MGKQRLALFTFLKNLNNCFFFFFSFMEVVMLDLFSLSL